MTQHDAANILAGPCTITVGDLDAGITVGETRLAITPELRARYADRTGQTPVDFIHLGERARLTLRVAEWTLETLTLVYPVSVPGSDGLSIGTRPGTRLATLAEPLTLHPVEFDDADTSRDITFWKAVAIGVVTVGFEEGKDRVFDVEFVMLPDISKPNGEQLGRIGAA